MASLDLVLELVDKTKAGLDSAGRNIDKTTKKTGGLRKASAAAGVAVGAIAVAGVGIGTALFAEMLDASQAIDNLSNTSKFGVENLQALGLIAKKSGGDIEDIADASREMQLRLAEAATLGSGPAVDALNLLGVSLEDIQKLKPEKQFELIRDKLSEIEDPAERAFLAEELLGSSTERLTELIALSADEFDAQRDAVIESGKVMSEDAVDGNVKAAEAMGSLLGSVKGLTTNLLSNLSPIVEKIAKFLEGNMTPAVIALSVALGVTTMVASINLAVTAFTKIKAALAAAKVAFAATKAATLAMNAALLANPIGIVIAVLVALGAALVIAYNKSETFREIVQNVWAKVKEAFQIAVDFIVETWDKFSGPFLAAFQALWSGVQLYFETVWNLISGYFQTAIDLIQDVFRIFKAVFTGDWRGVWDGIKNLFSNAWNNIFGTFSTTIDNILSKFGFGRDALARIWDNISSKVSSVWDGITGMIKGAINGIIGFINRLVNAWNGLQFKIPEITLPKVNLPFGKSVGGGTFGGQSFSFPKLPTIPRLAEGGVVTSPTLALIGEAGPEAVVPLNRSRGAPQALTVILNLDGVELGQAIVSNVNEASRRGELLLQGNFTQ